MDVEDLKRRRFVLLRQLSGRREQREQFQHLEAKIEAWQVRSPVRSLGEEVEELRSSIELQAEFEQFRQQDRRRMLDLRDTVANLEARVNLLRPRAPTDVSWEAVSERVASDVSRASETLNDRMIPEVVRAIQTHSNSSPIQTHSNSSPAPEDIQGLDSKIGVSLRAFSHEVEEWGWMTQTIEGQASQADRERKCCEVDSTR